MANALLFSAELEREVQQRFGADISRDERQREQNLQQMSSDRGVTYTAPGEKYPSAQFSYSAPRPEPVQYSAPAPVSSKPAPAKFTGNDDADLDAMLGGLDDVSVVAQPPKVPALSQYPSTHQFTSFFAF
jgi:hypothetical protein